jgi:hypothetical protein
MNAQLFAQRVVDKLAQQDATACFLEVRGRGSTATIGYHDVGEWVGLLRIAHGSAAYNVANLEVRHRQSWQPTFVRSMPDQVAASLLGDLRLLWEGHAPLEEG